MSKSTDTAKAPSKKSRGIVGVFIAVACAIGAVAMLPVTVLVVIGMIPTAVAYFVDNSREKALGPTILFLNLAGVAPLLIELLNRGPTMANALDILIQPNLMLIMLLPAAFGWVIYIYIPVFAGSIARRRAEARIRSLEKEQESLIAQWGNQVSAAGAPPPAAPLAEPVESAVV